MSDINKMRGKVTIIGLGDSDLESSLQLRLSEGIESEITVRADKTVDLGSEFWVVYGGNLDLDSVIQVQFNQDLEGILWVKPHNKMTGLFEVVEPPTFKESYEIVRDAFVRSDVPALNYGTEQDMFAGVGYEGETYRSLIQFAPIDLPPEKKVKKAEIVLKVMTSGKSMPLGLYEIKQDAHWDELEVTWAIQPDVNGFVAPFEGGTYYGNEVRIDVTDLAKDWHENHTPHNGFLIKALDESVSGLYKSYGTKENGLLKPYLEVTYYDPTVFSYGRGQLRSQIDIREYDELSAEIQVKASWVDEDLPSELYVTIPMSREGEIFINKPDMASVIYVPYTNDFTSSLKVRRRFAHDFGGQIIINAPQREGSIDVKYWEQLASSIIIRTPVSDDQFGGSIVINREQVDGSIDVKFYGDLEGSAYVIGRMDEDLPSEIQVIRSQTVGEITVPPYNYLNASITVRDKVDDTFESQLLVNRPSEEGSIYVRPYNDLPLEVYVRAKDNSDLESEMFVASPWMNAEIRVRVQGSVEIPAELMVRAKADENLESSIVIRVLENEDLPSTVTIRVEANADLEGTLLPRIPMAGDLPSTIEIIGVKKDLPAEIKVQKASSLDGSIEVVAEYGYCFIM